MSEMEKKLLDTIEWIIATVGPVLVPSRCHEAVAEIKAILEAQK